VQESCIQGFLTLDDTFLKPKQYIPEIRKSTETQRAFPLESVADALGSVMDASERVVDALGKDTLESVHDALESLDDAVRSKSP